MRALVASPDARFGVALSEAPDVVPLPGQLLINVRAISLNFGDVNGARGAAPGTVPGWDAAGVVARSADGGPAVGTPVLTFGYGAAWAQRRAVPVGELAVVPEGVDLGTASALPVAGVTALRALRRSGSLIGRRVLVTGASGGVGRFAVQLARRAGAHVVAQARRGDGLAELGADEVVQTLDAVTSVTAFDVVVDNVGGQQLVAAWQRLAVGGVIQSVGWTSGEPATFPVYATVGPAKSLTSFQMGDGLGEDLAFLLALVRDGELVVDVGLRTSWTEYDAAVDALLGRRVSGKAVLDVD